MRISLLSSHPQLVLVLLALSTLLYAIDYYIFGHADEIGVGFLGNLAFLPIYVLFVTLMVERVLKERERIAMRRKLNMVIGVFFSEMGNSFLRHALAFVEDDSHLVEGVKVQSTWGESEFRQAVAFLEEHDISVNSRLGDLVFLKDFLLSKRDFLLALLGNPNLLEHDEFTDLLWAVFHLLEELGARASFTGLPEADIEHLAGDIKRAYRLVLREWISYLEHLKSDYPYLFSLAVRTNPLNPDARAVIS